MEDCLPTEAFVREVFESAGFSAVSSSVVIQKIAVFKSDPAREINATFRKLTYLREDRGSNIN